MIESVPHYLREPAVILDRSLDRLCSYPIPQLADEALKMARDIEAKDLNVVLVSIKPSNEFPRPLTIFNIVSVNENKGNPFPPIKDFHAAECLFVNYDDVLSNNESAIDADLMRSLAVRSQYPGNYARRYQEVLYDALCLQAEWLNISGNNHAIHDPRFSSKGGLTRNLLGDNRYFSDFGIEDWWKEVQRISLHTQNPQFEEYLEPYSNPEIFIFLRSKFTPQIHSELTEQFGDSYINTMDADDRARLSALRLTNKILFPHYSTQS